MKIQCRIKRQGGSHVTIGGKDYHFAPDDLGRHVTEVEDETHIARFLEIPEYTEANDDPDAPAVSVTQGQTLAPQDTTQDTEQGNTPSQEDSTTPSEDDELETARDEYEAYFGTKAHHAMKASTIRERIQQAKDAKE